jgi:AbrB family looped-hinge helix DNA binding protein
MEVKVVDKRGRVVVPAELRRKYNFKSGAKVVFIDTPCGVELLVVDKNYFESIAGVLGLRGKHLRSLVKGKKAERML